MKRILFLILGVVIGLSGCSMIPKYSRPAGPIPEHWPSGPAYQQTSPAPKVLDAAQLKWREFFTDPKLQKIIETALYNNRDLRLAALNVERARALYGVQRAELFPVVNAGAGFNKEQYSSDFISSGASRRVEQYSVNLGITSWEIDFFGRIRSLKKQALEEYLGTEEARRGAQITLISEVARAYLAIAADRTNLNLARSTLKAQEDAYNLVMRKYNINLVGEIDLERARTQVDTARGDVVLYIQQVAQDENALNLLAGSPVPEDLLPVDLESVTPFMDVSPGLSSEVLLKRPDIMSVEHQLKGAYANIGAARAAFFPSISLTTAVGSASNEFSGLFKAGKGTWVYNPQIVMPIFDTKTWAAYRVSEADRKIALAQYEKVIQNAFREVADVLAVRGTVDQQIAAQQSVVNSAQKIYRLSSKRYDNGIDSYLSVLDAQRSLYSAQQGLISLEFSKLANEVKAYAVLGGGGQEESPGNKPKDKDSFQENILSLLSFGVME
ncbi:MAG: efflux transporter outer membrane subunit [Candidatus Omnitrophica bacterium]|nr:efflux transporter outer membrane subunit [Candidatus Omnitrophota bacterium]